LRIDSFTRCVVAASGNILLTGRGEVAGTSGNVDDMRGLIEQGASKK
jgi:hypothetical protein